MLHLNSLTVCIVLSAMAAFTRLAETLPTGDVYSVDRTLTECDRVKRVSIVCYRCAKRYEESFIYVHDNCCSGPSNEVRIHCEELFTAPDKRDG